MNDDELRPCSCNAKHNLPMFMENEAGREWIECDFCGKRTSGYRTTADAVEQWDLIAEPKPEREQTETRYRKLLADVERHLDNETTLLVNGKTYTPWSSFARGLRAAVENEAKNNGG